LAQSSPHPYEVAAYYFPQFHPDPLNDLWHGKGWTEWEVLKSARPRFAGHRQPIVPEWGYFDEADPAWAAREIDLAADHGISAFLYDWYWYKGRPFLQGGLEHGFLHAPNQQRLKFALMWANHDWVNLYPARFTNKPEMLASGRVSKAAFERLTDYVISTYFTRPNYLALDGAPYFSIYDLGNFVAGLGGIDRAAEALVRFRNKVREAGFPDLHLNAISLGVPQLPGEHGLPDENQAIARLGIASVSSYAWIHHHDFNMSGFPTLDYRHAAEVNVQAWHEQAEKHGVPFFPNVSVGWDSSPRTAQSDRYEAGMYPWLAVLTGNSPSALEAVLKRARDFLDQRPRQPRLVTLNAWNEWTEGSYLLPDTKNGSAFLEAVRAVFGESGPNGERANRT
jgi:hypothetical protein